MTTTRCTSCFGTKKVMAMGMNGTQNCPLCKGTGFAEFIIQTPKEEIKEEVLEAPIPQEVKKEVHAHGKVNKKTGK